MDLTATHTQVGLAIAFLVAVGIFIFQLLLWRRTGIGGFGILALLFVINRVGDIGLVILIRSLPHDTQSIIQATFNTALALVALFAWWRIYTHTAFQRERVGA